MPEQYLFDPTGENTGTQLDVSDGTIYGVTAFSAPAPSLETATAGSIDTEGDLIAARRHQNRQIQMTVEVVGSSQANLDANVATLEAKVTKLASEGGTFRRVRADGTFKTADVLAADQYEKAFDVTYFVGNMAVCQVNLIVKPYARGTEVLLGTFSETTLPVLTFPISSPAGDVPALGRLRVTDIQPAAQANLWWGLESRYYDPTTSLLFQAESQILKSGTTSTADATASGGNCTTTTFSATAEMFAFTAAHVGTYRVMVRAQTSTIATSPTVNLAYSFNDITGSSTSNRLTATAKDSFGAASAWQLLDLGVITIPKTTLGTQAWTGRIRAQVTGLTTMKIDYVWLVPAELSGSTIQVGNDVSTGSLLSGFSTEIRYDGVHRQDTAASWNSAAVPYEGDYLKVPVGRSSRFSLKASRRTFSASDSDDPNIDDISAQLWVTPRYLSMF